MALKIHETTEDDGSLAPIALEQDDDALVLVKGGKRLALPNGALAAVMRRLGRELDPGARVFEVARLETNEGVLRHVRHLDAFDVIARDWLVLGDRCALATTAAGALEHLARANVSRNEP
ncbi:MAG: hypothetical protein KIT84_40595 [Labilithrix sp.]|nr:hypothetical protein [Labilithrix sp.]MCW5817368.1 hypothetical protein [Labilithrix sp.]